MSDQEKDPVWLEEQKTKPWRQKFDSKSEPHVLVGFGKHSLLALMSERHTEEGWKRLAGAMDVNHWPPRWRRASLCNEEEIACFQAFVNLVQKQLEKEND